MSWVSGQFIVDATTSEECTATGRLTVAVDRGGKLVATRMTGRCVRAPAGAPRAWAGDTPARGCQRADDAGVVHGDGGAGARRASAHPSTRRADAGEGQGGGLPAELADAEVEEAHGGVVGPLTMHVSVNCTQVTPSVWYRSDRIRRPFSSPHFQRLSSATLTCWQRARAQIDWRARQGCVRACAQRRPAPAVELQVANDIRVALAALPVSTLTHSPVAIFQTWAPPARSRQRAAPRPPRLLRART